MIVGIDLGTTNSLVAVWEGDAPKLIPNSLGSFLTPSCVSIDEDGSILIGQAARERLQSHPDRSAAVFKRYMGSDKQLKLANRMFRAEELSALILRSLKADAEAYLGQPVTEAIITVPAYFSDAQRQATRTAGQLAGLTVERLLNEPTAAALAHGIHLRDGESRFLVFDLGGGTFDVSILDLFEGVMEVRASAGDNMLGGEDFVSALIDLFCERTSVPDAVKREPVVAQRLNAMAERAKRTLSDQTQTTMSIEIKDKTYSMEIDETLLEQTCANLLARLRTPVERALRDANFRPAELDSIVLAGGATRMPVVRKMVARMFGRFPAVDVNPDEVVALGAAVQAGLKSRHAALKEVVMTDVAPYSMGVSVSRELGDGSHSHGHFDPIIERNSIIPISRMKEYYPIDERQSHIEFQVYQGEARMASDNVLLGKLRVPVAGKNLADKRVDVRFTYDVNGILQVEAQPAHQANSFSLVIEGNPGLLTPEEIAQRLASLAQLKIHPRDRMETRTLMARAERIYQVLRGQEREWLDRQIMAFEQALASQDERTIKPAMTKMEEMLDHIERHNRLNPEGLD